MSFPEGAHQYIQDKELRRSGGYRGIVRRKELKLESSAAVFAANPPPVLKRIVTAKGVHLIFVGEVIQPELDDKLRHQILLDLFCAWLNPQTDLVEVVTNLDSTSSPADTRIIDSLNPKNSLWSLPETLIFCPAIIGILREQKQDSYRTSRTV